MPIRHIATLIDVIAEDALTHYRKVSISVAAFLVSPQKVVLGDAVVAILTRAAIPSLWRREGVLQTEARLLVLIDQHLTLLRSRSPVFVLSFQVHAVLAAQVVVWLVLIFDVVVA